MKYKCKDCGFECDSELRYLFHRRYGCYSFHESMNQYLDNKFKEIQNKKTEETEGLGCA